MRVRLLVSLSGTRNGVEWPTKGNTIDLPEQEARDMIHAQQAIPDADFRHAETAVAPSLPVETRAVERPLATDSGLVPGKRERGRKP